MKLKHKIETLPGGVAVLEKRAVLGIFGYWLYVDSRGDATYEEFSDNCFTPCKDHAQRIIDYRLKNYQ